jgi:transposase
MSHKTAATVAHTIGIDTGKNILHLIGLDDKGAIVLREKISRGQITARLANVPRCLIGIEAGIHDAARYISAASLDGFSPASTSTAPRHWPKPCRSTHQVWEATE